MSTAQVPLSSFGLELRPQHGPVVGRPAEMLALEQAMDAVAARAFRAVILEGEPGIGKTRLLEAAADLARARGFQVLTAISDEELRGPLLLARSLFASPAAASLAERSGSPEELLRLVDALSGRPAPGLEALPPDRQLIHLYDVAAVAVRAMAGPAPLALLLDDVQWADEDSIRILRYVVRAQAATGVLLVLALRPEDGGASEVATLVADLERVRAARRLRLGRFTTVETGELLRQLLGGDISPAAVAALHDQAEGVPFMVEELALSYRDAGLLQQIQRTWELAPKAGRLLPPSVEMLIRRRAKRLPRETQTLMAEAAVLGRAFGLHDLAAVKRRVDEDEPDPAELAAALEPAVQAGLVAELPEGSAVDYRFNHEQIRTYAAGTLPRARRRELHGAVVALLMDAGPPPDAVAMLAHHAVAAGLGEQCARYSIEAARVALDRNAPDEVLRLVDESLDTAQNPRNRIDLLRLRDDALAALRRPGERLRTLPQLAALAEALGDVGLEIEIRLRRAAALRLNGDEDRAAELARDAQLRAREAGDRRMELQAVLELGQAITRSGLGDAPAASVPEGDLARAEEAYDRATALAQDLGDPASEAAAWRELGTIWLERARKHFQEFLSSPDRPTLRNAPGHGFLFQIPGEPEIVAEAVRRFTQALDLYERLGDQHGMMATLIAMAYARTGADIRFGSARRIEDLRRIVSRLHSLVRESDRERQEVQMLYGVHLYARAFGFPDLALERGDDAYRGALRVGDRDLEFLAAGGTALVHLNIGELPEAISWLDRAAEVAAATPSALRARDLEAWRGMVAGASGDAGEMSERLERALRIATEQGKQAGRCEVLARWALESARLARATGDEALLAAAGARGAEAAQLAGTLKGDHPWTAQAEAARALVLDARADGDGAVAAARAALAALEGLGFRESEPPYPLHLDVILAALQVLSAREGPGLEQARTLARTVLQMVGERTLDEGVRVRWFRAPIPRALVELTGPVDVTPQSQDQPRVPESITDREAEILRMIVDGMTNQEIAEAMGIEEDRVVRELAEIYAKLGVSSRAGATVFAMMEGVA
ncbi:MAG TPA: AAA family ATPase [Actinomycetota bacterium]|nr:AAA family ATPase [Actinomycetota bacterium]